MLLLRKIGCEIEHAGPLLTREEVAALLESEEIIRLAKEEAASIREEAKVAYEAEKTRGYEEGLETGRAEMAEAMVRQMSQTAQYFAQVESTIVELVMKALRKVLGEIGEREMIERAVHKAMETTRRKGHITIRVPPRFAQHLQSRLEELLAAFPRIDFVEVVADERLPADGCVLETEVGVVNATVENQLRTIEKALINSLR